MKPKKTASAKIICKHCNREVYERIIRNGFCIGCLDHQNRKLAILLTRAVKLLNGADSGYSVHECRIKWDKQRDDLVNEIRNVI